MNSCSRTVHRKLGRCTALFGKAATEEKSMVLVFMLLLQTGEGGKQSSRWEKHLTGQSLYTRSELSVLSSSSFQTSPNSSFIFLARVSFIKDVLGVVFTVFLVRNQAFFFLPKVCAGL